MVLGGYSQGAAVVDVLAATGRPILGFTVPCRTPSQTTSPQWSVFGNPSNRIGEPLTALSPLYGSKAIDLCNGADPVCSNGNDMPAHSLYVEAGMAIRQRNSSLPGSRVHRLLNWQPAAVDSGKGTVGSISFRRHDVHNASAAGKFRTSVGVRITCLGASIFLQSAAHAGDDDDR